MWKRYKNSNLALPLPGWTWNNVSSVRYADYISADAYVGFERVFRMSVAKGKTVLP